MNRLRITSTEAQNNFGKYLRIATELESVIITKNGREIAKLEALQEENVADEINEKVAPYNTDNRKMTFEEFVSFYENADERYEFIDGVVYALASPSFVHQVVVSRLIERFMQFFEGKKCIPLMAPFDVYLIKNENETNLVQPDLLVLCDKDKINEKGKYTGTPTLVIEVISPTNRKHDMVRKLDLYMKSNIKECWLVDPEKLNISVYKFKENGIDEYSIHLNDMMAKSFEFEGLEVDLKKMFKNF